MVEKALEIISVSNAAELELEEPLLEVGDKILEVSGEAAADQLDFLFHSSQSEAVSLRVQRRDGRIDDIVLSSEVVAALDIRFKPMDFRRCRCKCPFCFVDQMPKGLRKSLYVKDEDFRLSFLYGNFTTMNDITGEELQKIIGQKNSPQWVSVHAVDEEMRRFIFGRPMKRDILATLATLAEAGISVHTQAVIVPGKNDGDCLRETIESLEAVHPNILTLAVVPVGLTRHREGLPELRTFRDDEMGETIDLVESYQTRFLEGARKSRFVFASDEWYLGASREVPGVDAYEEFPQLDNGVGCTRQFAAETEDALERFGLPGALGHIRVVTGALGTKVFDRYIHPMLRAYGAKSLPEVVEAKNNFFGKTVTCSGLMVGEDILAALKKRPRGRRLPSGVTMIPNNCLNHERKTIDDMDLDALSASLGEPVVTPEDSFVESLFAFAGAKGVGG